MYLSKLPPSVGVGFMPTRSDRCLGFRAGINPISAQISNSKLLLDVHLRALTAVEHTLTSTKSPSIPLYKGGIFLRDFDYFPPFDKGGVGGI
jgi:hypothetical protein